MKQLPAWTPFARGSVDAEPPSDEKVRKIAISFGVSEELVRQQYKELQDDEIWLNSRYQVNIRRFPAQHGWPACTHLSIKRRDKDRVGPERYRDFLRIKNELVGEENEGVELYPAMDRNVDTANQYHLYVITDPALRFPFGFKEGKMIGVVADGSGARQHPFDKE